ncbi:MAG: DUF871 domain-containing protein [Metamycoplasmataceae bacterium]
MLGISIYPEKNSKEEILNYISLANKYGFKRIFTCLLSVNDPKEKIKKDFQEIIKKARNYNMEVILDIAPSVFNKLEISYDDLSFFAELGATGIRLDEGFDGLKESKMTYNKFNLDIEINMSSGTKYVDNILSFEPNKNKLIACHNFYPMEFSGLSLEHFIKTSKQYRKLGIRSAAFVTSHVAKDGPWPIMDGLCTLEMHRNLPITTQVKHLKMLDLVDDIIIGNAFASEEELKSISELYDFPSFDVIINSETSDVERKIILEEEHHNRGDTSEFLIRSTWSRVKYKDFAFPKHNISKNIKMGAITIGNNDFGQYKGELHLVLKEHNDSKERKNIVANVVDHEKFLLTYLKPWQKFSFSEFKK